MQYIGIHTTKNINDGYSGSGSRITKAIKEFGKPNFSREIIKFCTTEDEMLALETELVDLAWCQRADTYNIRIGGRSTGIITDDSQAKLDLSDTITVKDEFGKNMRVSNTDPMWLSGKLTAVSKGSCTVKDVNGNRYRVPCTDPRILSGELVGVTSGNTLSEVHKYNLSSALKNVPKSAEMKSALSNYAKTRAFVNKNGVSKRINKQELNNYLSNGWSRGRGKNS